MRADLADLLYRLPADLREPATKLVADLATKPAQSILEAVYADKLGAFDQAGYFADQKKSQAAVARSRTGRVKSRLARRRGPADPRGKSWKPCFSGKLNRAVFPKYGITPPYVRPLLPYLGNTLRGAILVIGLCVDCVGRFTLPTRHLANILQVSPWTAQDALGLLEAAGIIRVLYQGERRQATVWEYPPVAEFKSDKAIRALQGAKNEAVERVVTA